MREYEQLKELFAAIKPDAVIHTVAASKPNYCQQNPQESYAINVAAPVNIAKLSAEYQIPCAFREEFVNIRNRLVSGDGKPCKKNKND